MYTFAGIAIVCDDFFVPREGVLKPQGWDGRRSIDVHRGRSAPSSSPRSSVFSSQSNVGFGTIIGGTVFNVLLVIGARRF